MKLGTILFTLHMVNCIIGVFTFIQTGSLGWLYGGLGWLVAALNQLIININNSES
jgi:hypothetical protein